MSKNVSNRTDKDLGRHSLDTEKILRKMEEFRNKHQSKITQPTIETLREIRYGRRYR